MCLLGWEEDLENLVCHSLLNQGGKDRNAVWKKWMDWKPGEQSIGAENL